MAERALKYLTPPTPLISDHGVQNRLLWVGVAFIGAAVVAVLLLDATVAQAIAQHHWITKQSKWVSVVKWPGNFWFTLGVSLLILCIEPVRLRAAGLPPLAGALGGSLYVVLKWTLGRRRPVYFAEQHLGAIHAWNHAWFIGGLRGIYDEKALSFPSGHATLAFATAGALGLIFPRWLWAWLSLAGLVALERVAENAHFVSDSLAGGGLGIFCALSAARFLRLRSDNVIGF